MLDYIKQQQTVLIEISNDVLGISNLINLRKGWSFGSYGLN